MLMVWCDSCKVEVPQTSFINHQSTKKHIIAATGLDTDYHIYKLVCKDPTVVDIYIGRTGNVKHRLQIHRTHSKRLNWPVYQKIRSTGGIENWELVIIKKCETRDEAVEEERRIIVELQPALNVKEKTASSNKQTIAINKLHKKWKESGIDRMTCQCGSTFNKQGRSQHLRTKKHRNFVM